MNMRKIITLGLITLFGLSVSMAQQPKSGQGKKKQKTEAKCDTTKKCCKKGNEKKCTSEQKKSCCKQDTTKKCCKKTQSK